MKLTDLTPWERNPRKISERAASGLQDSVKRFGDLSGLVYNVRNKSLVGGHQRKQQLVSWLEDAEIQDVSEPDDAGDRWGHIIDKNGRRWNVRLVDWGELQHLQANIAANNTAIAGEFTDGLDELLAEIGEEDLESLESLRFNDLAEAETGHLHLVNDTVEISEVTLKPPPSMTWCLIGIPISRWGEIAQQINDLSSISGIVLEVTSSQT